MGGNSAKNPVISAWLQLHPGYSGRSSNAAARGMSPALIRDEGEARIRASAATEAPAAEVAEASAEAPAS